MAAGYGKPCFVYMSSQGKCFLRDWCSSYANGCDYGEQGTESWEFSTYIKQGVSPSPTRRRQAPGYVDYAHYNCYDGHGGSGTADPIYTSVDGCAGYGKPCFVYFSSQGTCFLRDWCNSHANGCDYGEQGTESWEFSTYIHHRVN